MKDKGYIFTLVTVILIMAILSLTLAYIQISGSGVEEDVSRLRTNELHYFVESVKSDYVRAASIASQRATVYSINYVIQNGKKLEDYDMINCTSFHYGGKGSQAAIAELMICGTLYGSNGTIIQGSPVMMQPAAGFLASSASRNPGVSGGVSVKGCSSHLAKGTLWYASGIHPLSTTLSIVVTNVNTNESASHKDSGGNYSVETGNFVVELGNYATCVSAGDVLRLTADDGRGNQAVSTKTASAGDETDFGDITLVRGSFVVIESGKYMQNHTILDWINRIKAKGEELNFIVDVSIINLTIYPYDAWNYAVTSKLNLVVQDKFNKSIYRGYDVPSITLNTIIVVEDPVYLLQTGETALTRYFHKCNETSGTVDSVVIDQWINSECYHSGNSSVPSFFDRLDGSTAPAEKYVQQSQYLAGELKISVNDIGLESIINLDKLREYNLTVNTGRSWVDYLYWSNTTAYCMVSGMNHSDFRIDADHALKYNVSGLVCSITFSNNQSSYWDEFSPDYISVPVNTSIVWVNMDATMNHTLSLNDTRWVSDRVIEPGNSTSWTFTDRGIYQYRCMSHPGRGLITVL